MPAPRKPRADAPQVHIALLRAVNVGGKNMLPMAALPEMFTKAGCTQVRTYIQSGNVVYAAAPGCAKEIPTVIGAAIETRFGFRPVLVTRTADELAKAARGNPFLANGTPPDTLHVGFLADAPGRKQVAALDPGRSPGDSFEVRGREIYLHLPSGVGQTKLTNAYLDKTLGTTSTVRNWRTVQKLIEMAREMAAES